MAAIRADGRQTCLAIADDEGKEQARCSLNLLCNSFNSSAAFRLISYSLIARCRSILAWRFWLMMMIGAM